jgi:hypothetical protein
MRALCFLLLVAFVSVVVVGAGGDGWVLGNRVAVTLPSLSRRALGNSSSAPLIPNDAAQLASHDCAAATAKPSSGKQLPHLVLMVFDDLG